MLATPASARPPPWVRPAGGAQHPEPSWVEGVRGLWAGPPRQPSHTPIGVPCPRDARSRPPRPSFASALGSGWLGLNGRERRSGGGRGRGTRGWLPADAPSLVCRRRRRAARSGVPCSRELRRRRPRHLPAEVRGAAPSLGAAGHAGWGPRRRSVTACPDLGAPPQPPWAAPRVPRPQTPLAGTRAESWLVGRGALRPAVEAQG